MQHYSFKWRWRYACEEGALWRAVVSSIHNEDHFRIPSSTLSQVSRPWKEIKKLGKEESRIKNAFLHNLSLKLGDGSTFRFWEDPSGLDDSLRSKFPRLYRISSQKKELISSMGWFEGLTWRWTLSWKRPLPDEEQHEATMLEATIMQTHL